MADSGLSSTPEAGGEGSSDRIHYLHQNRNGRAGSPSDEFPPRSPSPRYRRYSDSTPTRSPSPMPPGEDFDEVDSKGPRKTKSVSFHSHTNWKSDRKIQSGKYFRCSYVVACEKGNPAPVDYSGRELERDIKAGITHLQDGG
ncbi:uncharacterized protein LOC125040546 [Penaeus chinensis]|uniref:uncharacterized protein LOC125040546 n=1 Tax=Penaeus chinensis TaxID=139456 RepID=UPI001FB5AEFC|nr:uncharacterized protein LOC125040546 [Penaeus chinensis]